MKKATIILGLFLSVFVFSQFTHVQQGYKVGDTVVDFTLKNVDGKPVSMASNAAAKGYILVFTCNTCPVSQAYEDRIIALHQRYASQGYPVLAINSNDEGIVAGDSFESMKERAGSKQYPFDYLKDADQDVAKQYGATRTPHVFVVQKKGTEFVVAYIGAIDDNAEDAKAAEKKYVEDAVNHLLAGESVKVSTTRAVGCGIKWKKA